MSAYQTNSSLARTRSLRAPATAKPTLTAPQTSAASHTSTKTTTTTTTAVINKSPQIPTCTSNVLLFLTNLRLLDLDHEPDWPDITPTTFSAKDAGGGQKRRIQCVEWALYRLFSLWDHNDAQNKLRPFYPPTDQVQSINLRSALVRNLEQAKKNGVLGRDVVIRKTMLDECKGERLEEVLAVFSSAVLKKMVAERALNSGPEYRQTTSESIALENWGYTGDRTELNGLLLAHKASLRSILEKKNNARKQYRDFGELLVLKERGIARRREQIKLEEKESSFDMTDMAKNEVHRILRNNWTGNEQWLDSLLLGDSSPRRGGLLSTPFDEVWNGVQTGNITDLEDQTSSLLEQLDKRVDRQRTRLQKWDEFRKKTFRDIRPRAAPVTPVRRNESHPLQFTAHLNLDPDAPEIANYIKFDNPPPEYARLMNELTAEVEGLKRTKIPNFSGLTAGVKRRPANNTSQFVSQPQLQPELEPEPEPELEPEPEPAEEPVSEMSEWEDEPEEMVPPPKAKESSINGHSRQSSIPSLLPGSRRQLPRIRSTREDRRSPVRRSNIVEPSQAHRRSRTEPSLTAKIEPQPNPIRDAPVKLTPPDKGSSTSYHHDPKEGPSSSISSLPASVNEAPTLPASRPTSPTQLLADQILTSMNNASPSPMKKSRYTLSLAERTRMSMSRTTSFEPEDESPQLSPVKESHTQTQVARTASRELEERGEEYEDLITRTRRSMVGFEAARQKAQLERRRSQRKSRIAQRKDSSYFPKLDEEMMGDISIAEGLIEAGVQDYEAVFKSRPRIATSPGPTPLWDDNEDGT